VSEFIDGPDAAVFDLDGVVTFTARIHAAAWKELFDQYLRSREQRFSEPFRPFDGDADYRAYVDGRPRYDGVQAFLVSRGIALPRGTPADSPDQETICGLGNRKNDLFLKKTQELGVDVDEAAVRFITELRRRGVSVGMASSSKNAIPILERVGMLNLFQAYVDGVVSEQLSLRGKPEPDIFLKCLQLLGPFDPRRAIVVEDAIAGVQAGRRGGFGLVLGVDRTGESALLENGADRVIHDFSEVSADKVVEHFRSRARVA
jgi:trehalose 6-phosphate phosphatase